MNFDFADVLLEVIGGRASDLHITAGAPPMIRVRGRLMPLEGYPVLTRDRTRARSSTRSSTTISASGSRPTGRSTSPTRSPATPASASTPTSSARSLGAAFRLIPPTIPSIESSGLPAVAHEFCNKPRGLVLVTGPTGSGKSTTLAAMIDEINETRDEHIMTDRGSDRVPALAQEVHGQPARARRRRAVASPPRCSAALRQDPDVILVGEMRDLETISTALTAAETGHLVFATLHTQRRAADDRPHHRRLPAAPAGPGARAALRRACRAS